MQFPVRCSCSVYTWNSSLNSKGWEPLLSSAQLLPVLSNDVAVQSGDGTRLWVTSMLPGCVNKEVTKFYTIHYTTFELNWKIPPFYSEEAINHRCSAAAQGPRPHFSSRVGTSRVLMLGSLQLSFGALLVSSTQTLSHISISASLEQNTKLEDIMV